MLWVSQSLSSHFSHSLSLTSSLSLPNSTASNSNRSTPTCSPVLRHRSRSPTPQQSLDPSGENMVEKGHLDPASDKDKSPSTPEQMVQRTYSQSVHSATRSSGGKNSKVSPCTWTRHTLDLTHTWAKTQLCIGGEDLCSNAHTHTHAYHTQYTHTKNTPHYIPIMLLNLHCRRVPSYLSPLIFEK